MIWTRFYLYWYEDRLNYSNFLKFRRFCWNIIRLNFFWCEHSICQMSKLFAINVFDDCCFLKLICCPIVLSGNLFSHVLFLFNKRSRNWNRRKILLIWFVVDLVFWWSWNVSAICDWSEFWLNRLLTAILIFIFWNNK